MRITFPTKTQVEPEIGVITVNWNDYANTARLLQSLRDISRPKLLVFVVDNGSTDGSLPRLQKDFPEISTIEMGYNAGFGAANNAALRILFQQGIPFSLLLNNDTIPDRSAPEALLAQMELSPDTGAVGAIIMEDTPNSTIQAYGGASIRVWQGVAPASKSPGDTLDFLTGACILFRNKALQGVGIFDETFFLYWEDADLCLRLRKAGWELKVSDAHIIHTGSVSTNRHPRRRSMQIMRSFSLLMHKHAKYPHLKALSATLFQSTGKILRGNLPAALGCWQGWHDAEFGGKTLTHAKQRRTDKQQD